MPVRGRDIEFGVVADLGDLAQHGLAIEPPEAGIDHQRCAGPNDDADVRDEPNVEVWNRVSMLGQLHGRPFPHQGVGHRTALSGRGRRNQHARDGQ